MRLPRLNSTSSQVDNVVILIYSPGRREANRKVGGDVIVDIYTHFERGQSISTERFA